MSLLGKRQDKAEIGTLFLTGKIVDEKKRGP